MVTKDEVRELAEELKTDLKLPESLVISGEWLCDFLGGSVRRAQTANLRNVYLGYNTNRKTFASFSHSEELEQQFHASNL